MFVRPPVRTIRSRERPCHPPEHSLRVFFDLVVRVLVQITLLKHDESIVCDYRRSKLFRRVIPRTVISASADAEHGRSLGYVLYEAALFQSRQHLGCCLGGVVSVAGRVRAHSRILYLN